MTGTNSPRISHILFQNLAVALAYVLSGMLMVSLTQKLGPSLVIHIPNGIALGAYIFFSYRILPGILLGSVTFLSWYMNVQFSASGLLEVFFLPFLLTLGTLFQTWVGGLLIHKGLRKDSTLESIREVLTFVFGVAFPSALVYSTWSTGVWIFWDQVSPGNIAVVWLTAWMANVLAITHIIPCFLIFKRADRLALNKQEVGEAIALSVVLYVSSQIVYGDWLPQSDYPLVYLLFPVLVWAALRFKQQGAVVAILFTALMATWGTGEGRGPMGTKSPDTAVILLQLYLFVLATMSFILGASVSTSRQFESEAAMLGHLLDRSINEVYVLDLDGLKFVQINQGACKRLGYTTEEMLAMEALDFTHGLTPQQFTDLIQRVEKDPDHMEIIETIHQCKDGTLYPVEAQINISTFGGKKYLLALAMDITQKRKAQEAIINARIRAEEANQAKSMFISNMSHEIRTPMNAILGYVQILSRDTSLASDQHKRVEGIQKAGNHLLGLINDILDFSKIEAGKMELTIVRFSLSGLIKDLELIFKHRCERNQLELKVDCNFGNQGRWVEGDQGKLRQVLINLLENAVKFTDRGEVLFRVSEDKQDRYVFEVIDTGCGIPLDKQQHVFEYFSQFDEGQQRGGTGLGLSISKRQVDLMGGTLSVESDPGWGSRFYFVLHLPATQAGAVDDLQDYDRVVTLATDQSVRALIVDDNQSNIEVLTETLEAIGVECQAVISGWDAIDRALSWKPDVIFMDYRMPGLNGLDTAKMIQKNLDTSITKIVMVTASSYRHEQEKFLQEGVHGFIAKPFLRGEVFKVLHDLLEVEFVYQPDEGEEEGTAVPIVESSFESLSLPEPLLNRLKQSARLGVMSQLEEELNEVKAIGHREAGLARHLQTLADNFDKQAILKVLEACAPSSA
ncbi:MASE1 domain-containing protein [Nitrospina watsonii]|uniref:histidine kinase n=1 Tax=Nitrospina watsonii TaxID=1323948 RepID=A0ABN8VZM4_9BACT|nr:MASE1 domain-containing protein [Nitrospina watsonii]CAI2717608.1 Putative Histidine kinase [Nitrospina watsonii]